MARRKSKAAIERRIEESLARIDKYEKKLEQEYESLAALRKELSAIEANRLYDAYIKSNKSMEQVLTFLGARK